MRSRDFIIVFAKLPIPGKVKTRLIGPLSAEQAAELHLACVRDTVALVNSLPSPQKVLMPAGSVEDCQEFAKSLDLPIEWNVAPQRGRNLGTKLHHAFLDAFRSGARRIVVIGTDSPWIGSVKIRQAFEALRSVDVVIGPATDGGYYLIGESRHEPGLFKGIPWGTRCVCNATLLAARKSGAQCRLLRRDFDLDRPEDLERLRAELASSEAPLQELRKRLQRRTVTCESSRRPELFPLRRKLLTDPE